MAITILVTSLSIRLVPLRLTAHRPIMSCRRPQLGDSYGNNTLELNMAQCLGTRCDTTLPFHIEYVGDRWDMEIF